MLKMTLTEFYIYCKKCLVNEEETHLAFTDNVAENEKYNQILSDLLNDFTTSVVDDFAILQKKMLGSKPTDKAIAEWQALVKNKGLDSENLHYRYSRFCYLCDNIDRFFSDIIYPRKTVDNAVIDVKYHNIMLVTAVLNCISRYTKISQQTACEIAEIFIKKHELQQLFVSQIKANECIILSDLLSSLASLRGVERYIRVKKIKTENATYESETLTKWVENFSHEMLKENENDRDII